MVPSVLSMNIVKHNIFHRSDEALLFVMVEAYLHFQNIQLIRSLKEFILIITGHKQNEKPTSTH